MKVLCIITCGSKKVWDIDPTAGPTPARAVYVGTFAAKCRDYAQRFYPSSWCILSAKHGFLFPDDTVPDSYHVTFNDRRTGPISVEQLAAQAVKKGLTTYEEIIVIGGRRYVSCVREALPQSVVRAPLSRCKGNGYMMQMLKRAVESGTPLTE